MFCSKCGAEIGDDVRFCPKCGTAISSVTGNVARGTDRNRHGFVTFWLVLGVIFGPIAGLMCFATPYSIAQYYPKASYSSIMSMGIISLADTVACILMLCWKKIGFWLWLGLSVVSIIISIGVGISIGYILSSFVGIAIMWGILHIRKNGKTTWEQLEKVGIE
jgi:uncharacterized membrane protein SpoIIM required for sporulation